jgi:hypothetical protein
VRLEDRYVEEKRLLAEAREAIQHADKAAAKKLLVDALERNPRSETAWLWLSALVDDVARERYCLGRVLEINPHNDLARSHLLKLDQAQSPSPEPHPPRASLQGDIPAVSPNTGPQPIAAVAESAVVSGASGQVQRRRLIWILIAIAALALALCCAAVAVADLGSRLYEGPTPTPMSPEYSALTTCRITVVGMLSAPDFSVYDRATYVGEGTYLAEGYYMKGGVRWDYGCTVVHTGNSWVAVDSWKAPH